MTHKCRKAAELVFHAPEDEKYGLLALMYHGGIGVEPNLNMAFEYAEKAAMENEGVALYLLGFMCENGETPDQFNGGPPMGNQLCIWRARET